MENQPNTAILESIQSFRRDYELLIEEISKVIVGYRHIIEHVIIGLFVGGHVLLEGVPGLGKTMLIRTLSQVLDLSFSRIQFTPDLMPADIVGTEVIDKNGQREYHHGPIFAHLVLADEINRATPKTQSALLECMQEKSVTAAGVTRKLDLPFLVMATQNPLEMEGTYSLPEAQLDRFMFKLNVPFPELNSLKIILERTTGAVNIEPKKILDGAKILQYMSLIKHVYVEPPIQEYVAKLVLASHPTSEYATPMVKEFVKYGSSPRGAQALIMASKIKALADNRQHISFDDVKQSAFPCLRHRLICSDIALGAAKTPITTDDIIKEMVVQVPVSRINIA